MSTNYRSSGATPATTTNDPRGNSGGPARQPAPQQKRTVVREERFVDASGQPSLRKTYSDGTVEVVAQKPNEFLSQGGNILDMPTTNSVDTTVPGANAGASAPAPAPARPAPPTTSGGYSWGNNRAYAPPAPAAPRVPGGVEGVAGSPGFAVVDYSRYDQAAQGYDRAVNTFQAELDRLSGVDPFGNQAFLRKATDRAVGQAAGLAAGGLSTATARAGNMRQAQGVQAQLAAQGRDQVAIQRAADETQAGALRLQAAGGMAGALGERAQSEVELAKLQTQTMAQNLDAYIKKYNIDATLTQQDVENLRQVTVQLRQLKEAGRQADLDALLKQHAITEQTYAALKQIAAQENISPGEFLMGTIGAAAGVAGGIATAPKGSLVNPTSDRRAKFDVRDPDLRDLEDFLGKTKGKLYRYREPNKPGRRAGLNFGPMAQDLAKSKIGATVVGTDKDGTMYVDAARLALADHAALAALAAEVKALKGEKK